FIMISRWWYMRSLPAFPTRRSSDLVQVARGEAADHRESLAHGREGVDERDVAAVLRERPEAVQHAAVRRAPVADREDDVVAQQRSEEHTSELQSRENLVCRLLLEKK